MSWYRTGTVIVTNGSKTVTGVGTLWTTAVNAGDAFALVDANLNPTGAWYEVESVTNNTTLVLKQSYAGITGSNKQYCVFNLVGNMTTPSFAQRLATFFASFQSLIDKPTTTPTASSIPIADANGDIDSGWIKDASTTVKGVVKVGANINGTEGTISVPDASTTVKGVVKVGANINGTEGTISVPDASATVKGVVELATTVETTAGQDATRAVTPAGFLAGLRGNLLGTVSQSDGVPTGAVIERGSNANGEYVKFADGTMICTGSTTYNSVSSTAFGTLFFVSLCSSFPATFTSMPIAICEPGYCEACTLWSTVYSPSTTEISMYTLSQIAFSSVNFAVRFLAIGRWF